MFFLATASGSLSEASFGLTTVPASDACALLVTGVAPGAMRIGLRAGDTIDSRALTMHERLRLIVPRRNDAMMLPAHMMRQGGALAMVMAMPSKTPVSDASLLRLGALALVMLLGLFVLWRGGDDASLGLGIFFAMIPAFFLSHAYAGWPDATIVAVLFIAAILNVFGYFGLFTMVDALAGAALTPSVRRGARSLVAAALAIAGIVLFASTYGRVFTGCPPPVNVQVVLACYATVIATCFLLLWLGGLGEAGSARGGRLRWLFWSTVIGYSGPLAGFVFIAAGRPAPLGGVFNLTFLAIPIGYTYAVLRHRVIDVGLVLNRALSLTVITTAIVVFFGITESILEHFATGHAESMVVQIGFSLVLGMAFNRVHANLEQRLERIFFKRRYEIDESLRELGERAGSFADEDALLREVAVSLQAALGLEGCAVYRESRGRFALAASAGATAFPAESGGEGSSLPIAAAGRVYGAIVIAENPQAEALASDEMNLLRTLATQLAAALAALRSERYEQLLLEGRA